MAISMIQPTKKYIFIILDLSMLVLSYFSLKLLSCRLSLYLIVILYPTVNNIFIIMMLRYSIAHLWLMDAYYMLILWNIIKLFQVKHAFYDYDILYQIFIYHLLIIRLHLKGSSTLPSCMANIEVNN